MPDVLFDRVVSHIVDCVGCANVPGIEELYFLCLKEVKTKVYHKACLPLAKWEVMFLQVATSTW